MSDLPKGDFNMPPGVRASDVPGNRPEDKDDESTCPVCGIVVSDEDSECPFCGAELI